MTKPDPLRAAALTLLADIAAGRDPSLTAGDQEAIMDYALDEGWIGELGEITPAGRAALAPTA